MRRKGTLQLAQPCLRTDFMSHRTGGLKQPAPQMNRHRNINGENTARLERWEKGWGGRQSAHIGARRAARQRSSSGGGRLQQPLPCQSF